LPPSLEELTNRLNQRCTENASDLSIRMKTAESEIQQVRDFDYRVMNAYNEIDQAIKDILAIVTAEKCRVNPRKIQL
jgi:guanylate kinase